MMAENANNRSHLASRVRALEVQVETFAKAYEREQELLSEARIAQNIEYMRRLSELNHAHEQAVADKSQYQTITVADAKYNELYRRIDATIATAAEASATAKMQGQSLEAIRTVVFGAVGLILVAVVGALLAMVLKR